MNLQSLIKTLLLGAILLGLGACQRGAQLDLALMTNAAPSQAGLLAMPTGVELINDGGRMFPLAIEHPSVFDLVQQGGGQGQRLALSGALPGGHYVGLRLVFNDEAWFEDDQGRRTRLVVDQTGPFADLDLPLAAGDRPALVALLDLQASVVRSGRHLGQPGFAPALSLRVSVGPD